MEKIINVSTAAARGEDVKVSQVPLVSRFSGKVDAGQVEQCRYYAAAKKLEGLESSMNAAKKAGDAGALQRMIDANPEAAAIQSGNKIQAAIGKLNKLAVSTVADREAMKQIDEARLEYMKALNEAMKELEQATAKPTIAQRIRVRG